MYYIRDNYIINMKIVYKILDKSIYLWYTLIKVKVWSTI